MRKAAGIILITLVVFGLVTLIIDVISLISILGIHSSSLVSILWVTVYRQIVYGGFLIAAGVLCLKRKYWGLCLAPPLFLFLIGISSVVEPLLREPLSISMTWRSWILVVGALISTIFICLRKSEWSESQP